MAIKASKNGTSAKTAKLIKTKAQAAPKRARKITAAELEQKIRERAYFLYINRGANQAGEHEDWAEAERQIKRELGLN